MNLLGNPFDYIIAFLGGVLVSFTPCVYPLIPVISGYIALRDDGSKLNGFSLSLSYVSGMAITYSILGFLASLTGTIFGQISVTPYVRIVVGLIIVLFGISLQGFFSLPLPTFNKISAATKRRSFVATFFLGMTSSLIVSPCLTPVLGSILLYLTTKKNILYGMTLLLVFAYGMGLMLLIVGTFSSLIIRHLPKSGRWMLYVKRACSFILIGMGLLFMYGGIRRL